jgi:prepilin signal peptidase PulO-like enzyme (type II secretory pathway)
MPYTFKDMLELLALFAIAFAGGAAVGFSLIHSQLQLAQTAGSGVMLFGAIASIEYIQNKVARREGYASHRDKVRKINEAKTKKKAKEKGFKGPKEYREHSQLRMRFAFHTFLMGFGAFIAAIFIAVILGNLYLFWVVFIALMLLVFLRNRL